MKLESQVVSLELAKKLKELGLKQESLWWWNLWGDNFGRPFITQSKSGLPDDEKMKEYLCSAFTVAELGEMLPNPFQAIYRSEETGRWLLRYVDWIDNADTEANARAKMLIHLIEQGIVKP